MLSFYIFLIVSFLPDTSKVAWLGPTAHSFGELQKGKTVTHVFEFKNISDSPLVIDNVRTDCGCTASDWEEEPVPIQEKGRITIHFDALKTGYFKKRITVWIKGMKKPEKLSIEGEVKE